MTKKINFDINMEKQLENRLRELAERSFQTGRYTYSDFLSEGECTLFLMEAGKFSFASPYLFGGADGCVRKVVRFGDISENNLRFPISTLKISPKNQKFAEKLSHRDILGATLSLGIERALIGDIIIKDNNTSFIFCLERIADFLTQNLTRIRHTEVICAHSSENIPPSNTRITERYFASSLRRDCVIAAVFRLSRNDVKEAFEHDLITINGMSCKNISAEIRSGDSIALRGKGKFYFVSSERTARGSEHITVERPT